MVPPLLEGTLLLFNPWTHVLFTSVNEARDVSPERRASVVSLTWPPSLATTIKSYCCFTHMASIFGDHDKVILLFHSHGLHLWRPRYSRTVVSLTWPPSLATTIKSYCCFTHMASIFGDHDKVVLLFHSHGLHLWRPR